MHLRMKSQSAWAEIGARARFYMWGGCTWSFTTAFSTIHSLLYYILQSECRLFLLRESRLKLKRLPLGVCKFIVGQLRIVHENEMRPSTEVCS